MPITYNNVPTSGNGGGAGNLFEGMKFWVAQRLGSARSEVLHNIKTNGGSIEPLDKNADYLIADPMRQPPPGSYKFAWITESVGKGQLLPAENYLIQNATAAVPTRKSGTGVATRSVRVPFTPSDDRYLRLFVAEMQSKGEPTEGNEIYKKLEIMNPRHTCQSWRTRWVKQLRDAKAPSFTEEDMDEIRRDIRRLPSDSSPEPPTAAPVAERTSATTTSPRTTDEPPSPTQMVRDNGIKIRHKFTREEDELLLTGWIDVLRSAGTSKKSDFFDGLTSETHTANSWRNRLNKTLEPALRNKLKTNLESLGKSGIPTFVKWFHKGKPADAYEEMIRSQASTQAAEQEEGPEAEEKSEPSPTPKQEKTKIAEPVKQAKKNPVRENQFPNSNKDGGIRPEQTVVSDIEDETPERPKKRGRRAGRAKSPVKSLSRPEAEPQQASPGEAEHDEGEAEVAEPDEVVRDEQRSPNSTSAAGQENEEANHDSHEEQAEAARQAAVQQEDREEAQDEVEGQESDEQGSYTRSRFWEDYQGWAEATHHKLSPFPSIAGCSFDLFDLLSHAMDREPDPQKRDRDTWEVVTENLGISWVEHPDAPEQVRKFFQQHLASFEEVLVGFEASDAEMTDTQSIGLLPSSPAAATQFKRPSILSDDDFETSQRGQKRQRRDRDDEIPSTPDDRTKTAHLRQYDGADEEDTNLPDIDTPRQPRSRGETQTQKETQYYDAQEYGEDMDDITPSQQLELESDAIEQPVYARSSPPPVPAGILAQTTTTPRRGARTPFRQDDSDEEEGVQLTPVRNSRDIRGKGNELAVAKRRSLPKSFARARAEEGEDDDIIQGDGEVQYPSLPHRAAQSPVQARSVTVSTSKAHARPQTSTSIASTSAASPSRASASGSTSAAQQVEQIIDHHIRLGYTRAIVVEAMYATTWNAGLSEIVMEGLKQGGGIPTNARGVWTEKDDLNLMLLDGRDDTTQEEPGAKREKKVAKAKKKLENKFSPEMIQQRRVFWEEGNVWRLVTK